MQLTVICSMAILLSKIHGKEHFALMTADHRMWATLGKSGPKSISGRDRLGVKKMALALNLKPEPDLFPNVFNLAKGPRKALRSFFGRWPLTS
jgi:hypothetical protein